MSIYLDYNASTPLRPRALSAMQEAWDYTGNASSLHHWGARQKAMLEAARDKLANLLGVSPRCVIFTSGATESNFLALQGIAPRAHCIVVGATEHASVRENAPVAARLTPSAVVRVVPVNEHGQCTPEILATELSAIVGEAKERPFVSLMTANHETGVINDTAALENIVKAYGGIFHTDATQALGRIPLPVSCADLMTLSSHKVGGPVGVGALILKTGLSFTAPIQGGGQEFGLRSGTEPIPLVQGFVSAVEETLSEEEGCTMKTLEGWKNEMENTLKALDPRVTVFGEAARRLPQTSCFALPGIAQELALMALDMEGIALGAGSACAAGAMEPSHVLEAMGVASELSTCALRVSMGWKTTASDVRRLTSTLKKHWKQWKGKAYDSAA